MSLSNPGTGVRALSWCLFAIGLAALALTAEPAVGQQKNPAKAAQKAADHQIIQELEATRMLLEKADHDYKGHRSAAVHEIMHAVHLLKHHKHHPNPAQHTAHLANPHYKKREAQSFSDMQLNQAMQQLQLIGTQIQSLGNLPHHNHAQKALVKAIQELQTALKIA